MSRKSTIVHDIEQFRLHLGLQLAEADHGGVMAAIDVITRDGEPETLMAVVRDHGDRQIWYSTGKTYSTYQHAFGAIGAALDGINPQHSPLSDEWLE